MHHCSEKSQLMTILEKQADQSSSSTLCSNTTNIVETDSVAVIDAMVIIQSLEKPKSVLSEYFCSDVMQLFDRYEEIHLVTHERSA